MLDILFPPKQRALRARSVSHEALAVLVHPIRIASTTPQVTSLLPYRNLLVQAAITEAKFHNARQAQEALGGILADYLGSSMGERPCVLLPVPLSRKRLRERGYNQAELICRAALRTLKSNTTIDTGLLQRIRDTPPQTGLGGQGRRANLEGAFTLIRTPDPHTLYIVVDDVTTTGAALSACIQALQAAGAVRIAPVALAHSP
ncbi:MAG: phosphoribosyltransferase [Parcubacteria group bacterium]|nr:phosphoribosyltransferase [Parcubacteria group bacterium]